MIFDVDRDESGFPTRVSLSSGQTLLVRVECMCGTIAAIPEGGNFPLCGQCGRRMVCPDRNPTIAAAYLVPESYALNGRVDPFTVAFDKRRFYDDDALRQRLEKCGFPTEPQDWPAVDLGDGDSVHVPPWEATA